MHDLQEQQMPDFGPYGKGLRKWKINRKNVKVLSFKARCQISKLIVPENHGTPKTEDTS